MALIEKMEKITTATIKMLDVSLETKTLSNKNLIENLLKFKGFNANLLRNFGFTSCVSYLCFNNQNLNTNFEKFSYAAMGGLIGSILTQPIDYIKTQQQRSNDKRSIYKILKNTINFGLPVIKKNKYEF